MNVTCSVIIGAVTGLPHSHRCGAGLGGDLVLRIVVVWNGAPREIA